MEIASLDQNKTLATDVKGVRYLRGGKVLRGCELPQRAYSRTVCALV